MGAIESGVEMDLTRTVWRKSTHSNGTGGACVELACAPTNRTIRDSKNPEAGVLVFGTDTTARFLTEVKVGRFDQA